MKINRGRKPIVYSAKKITEILDYYIEVEKPFGEIKYKQVFLFVKEMYSNNIINMDLSEDFWRKPNRQGREAIDKLNRHRNISIKKNNDYIEVVSTENIINSYSNDIPSIKKQIIAKLKINEYGYKNLHKKYTNLLFTQNEKDKELTTLKEKLIKAEEKNKIYEQVLFQWANASNLENVKLINTITTGKTRSKIVEQLFVDMFSENPNKAYKEINLENKNKQSNVIELSSKKKNNLIEDLDL